MLLHCFGWRFVIGRYLGWQSYHRYHYHLVGLLRYYQYYFGFVYFGCFQSCLYYRQMLLHCFGWRFVIGRYLGWQSYHRYHYHHFEQLHCFLCLFEFVYFGCFQNSYVLPPDATPLFWLEVCDWPIPWLAELPPLPLPPL